MSVIVDLVLVGVKKLVDLVPVWMNASDEKKAEIEGKAKSLVDGLDLLFKSADEKDAAALKAAQDAINAASGK
jgi:hypothetical protein